MAKLEESGVWNQVRDLFEETLALPRERRISHVGESRLDSRLQPHVLALLRAIEPDEGLSDESTLDTDIPDGEEAAGLDDTRLKLLEEDLGDTADLNTSTVAGPADGKGSASVYGPGAQVGAYRLERSLGAGGMGTVFLARRSDASFDHRVAIKLLKKVWASPEEIDRFRRERQILAGLKHPAIAQLLDGGNTDLGQPYLVLEFVDDGVPIDEFCRRHRLKLEQRLDLFLQVCAAVQFAHRNLIVHRDLKPSNILVDRDGRVKLLDFGIAKILEPSDFAMTVLETRPGSSPMTLAYASPEQIQGQTISISTDVYSLGMVLYELLSDRRPYDVDSQDLLAVVSVICNQEITSPSRELRRKAASESESEAELDPRTGLIAWRRVQGDLDAIVLKALAKDPEHRYASVDQLIDDLGRFQSHLPVRARVGSMAYFARKFVYRHRFGLSAAAGILFLLVGSILVLLQQQRLLIDQRNFAQQQELRAQTVADWMTELFELPDPGRSLGEQVTARELLDKSAESVQVELAHDPDLLGQMLTVLGTTYSNLGLYTEAEAMMQSALELAEANDRTHDAVELQVALADLAMDQGRYLSALQAVVEVSDRAKSLLPAAHPTLTECLKLRGAVETRLGRYAEAEEHLRQAELRARSNGDSEGLDDVLRSYGELANAQGRFEFAEGLFRESLVLKRRHLNKRHPKVAELESNLAFSIAKQKAPAAAEQILRDAIQSQRQAHGDQHVSLAISIDRLATLLADQDRFDEAEAFFRESIEMGMSAVGASHPLIARFLSNYGYCQIRMGDLDEAEALFHRVKTIVEAEHRQQSLIYGNTQSQLGSIAYRRAEFAVAEQWYRSAVDVLEAAVGLHHPKTVMALSNVATAKTRLNELAEARLWYQKTIDRARNAREPMPELTYFLFNAALNDNALGNLDAAVVGFEEVAERDGVKTRSGLEAMTYLSHLHLSEQRWADAERFGTKAVAGWESVNGAEAWKLSSLRAKALATLELGRRPEARVMLEERLARLESNPSSDPKKVQEAKEDLNRALQ